MEENFEYRPLLNRDLLRSLQKRQDRRSLIHLTLHLGTFALCLILVVYVSSFPIAAILMAVILGAIWTTLFAPFHECTHQTAFRSRRLNAVGAWLTGVPYGMAPAFYRDFHFAHHRYTRDPARDPEIAGAPEVANWPTTPLRCFQLIAGLWLIRLKVKAMLRFALSPAAQPDLLAPWVQRDQQRRIIWETRVVALLWFALVVLAVVGVRGARWILLALVICHVFQAVWLTAEHGGLSSEGTILARTRTTRTFPFVSWWLWNMNYHAEHHAWPSIPWHALPAVHQRVAGHVEHQARGYWRLQLSVLRRNNLPDGVPVVQTAK